MSYSRVMRRATARVSIAQLARKNPSGEGWAREASTPSTGEQVAEEATVTMGIASPSNCHFDSAMGEQGKSSLHGCGLRAIVVNDGARGVQRMTGEPARRVFASSVAASAAATVGERGTDRRRRNGARFASG
jgi:hypothetical protein